MEQRVLVLALPGLGDSIMALDAMRMLRASARRLDALCMQGITREFLTSTGLFDEVIYAPLLEGGLIDGARTIAMLRRRNYDASLTVYPSYRWQYHLLSALIGAKRRSIDAAGVPFARVLNPHAVQTPDGHNAQRNRALARRLTSAEIPNVQPVIRGNRQGPIVLHVGSMKYKGNEHKRWPAEKFIALGARLASDGHQVAVVAGPHDLEDSFDVVRALEGRAQLAKTETFERLCGVIDSASVVVGNDAGVVHLSAYRGVPTVVLYGLTDPARVHPVGPLVSIVRPTECPPCFHPRDLRFYCKLNIGFRCLNDLTVEHAHSAVRSAFARSVNLAV